MRRLQFGMEVAGVAGRIERRRVRCADHVPENRARRLQRMRLEFNETGVRAGLGKRSAQRTLRGWVTSTQWHDCGKHPVARWWRARSGAIVADMQWNDDAPAESMGLRWAGFCGTGLLRRASQATGRRCSTRSPRRLAAEYALHRLLRFDLKGLSPCHEPSPLHSVH